MCRSIACHNGSVAIDQREKCLVSVYGILKEIRHLCRLHITEQVSIYISGICNRTYIDESHLSVDPVRPGKQIMRCFTKDTIIVIQFCHIDLPSVIQKARAVGCTVYNHICITCLHQRIQLLIQERLTSVQAGGHDRRNRIRDISQRFQFILYPGSIIKSDLFRLIIHNCLYCYFHLIIKVIYAQDQCDD